MYCENCGAQNTEGASYCSNCGAPMGQQANFNYQTPATQPKRKIPSLGMGITSMVLGATTCGFLCYAIFIVPCAIIGLILGCMANSRAKAVGLKNGFATAGIITSVIGLVLAVCSLFFVIYIFDNVSNIGSNPYYYYYFINNPIF